MAWAPDTRLSGKLAAQPSVLKPLKQFCWCCLCVKGGDCLGVPQLSWTCRELLIFGWLQAHEHTVLGSLEVAGSLALKAL